ncbi:MAG TPA: PH domain-containing protein [Candidatus Paceibacterota bacterium]|nr:PH domain-containing protein [Candidatus Paceibacterota bacterium]
MPEPRNIVKSRRARRAGQFGAPWGRCVKRATAMAVIITLGVAGVLPWVLPPKDRWAGLIAPAAIGVTLAVTALFCVRGYTVRRRELVIHRLLWETRLPLGDLQSARQDPEALKGAVRMAGNGGFLAITGWFYSKRLGKYRAFVTDPARSVVLEFKNRKVVVSPEDPEGLITVLGFDPAASRQES